MRHNPGFYDPIRNRQEAWNFNRNFNSFLRVSQNYGYDFGVPIIWTMVFWGLRPGTSTVFRLCCLVFMTRTCLASWDAVQRGDKLSSDNPGNPAVLMGFISGLFGLTLRLNWGYIGVILRLCWAYIGVILGLRWVYIGQIFRLCWAYIGAMLG